MRALIALVVVMGLAILIGSTTLVVLLVQRAHAPGAASPAAATGTAATLALGEPEGTRIAATAAAGDRLVVQLSGGGPDRLVVLDLRANTILARIALGH